jgi:hypothetical protein
VIRAEVFGFDVVKAAGEKFVKVHRAVTLDVHRRWVQRCPRDTGRAQNSVVASRNAPSTFVPAPGVNLPPASTQDAMAALADLKPGERTLVSSNLVYMPRLNDGSSKQAGAHFIEAAVEEAVSPFRR